MIPRTVERRQAADRARLLASTGATLHVRGQDLPAHWFREYMAYDPPPTSPPSPDPFWR